MEQGDESDTQIDMVQAEDATGGLLRGVVLRNGEGRLMYAILNDAINLYLGSRGSERTKRLVAEAEEWMFTIDALHDVSFEDTCAALGLEPGWLRRGLRKRRLEAEANPRVIGPKRREYTKSRNRKIT